MLLSAAILIGGLSLGCSDDDDKAVDTGTTEADADETTTTEADGTTTTGADAEPAEGDQAVSISNYTFEPESITVKAGTKVTWTNSDDVAHTATSDDGAQAEFDTGDLEGDGSGEFTFEEPGTYAYHCDIHDYMKGTVEVAE
jgi:plastocyanin